MLRHLRNAELLVTLAITALYVAVLRGLPYSFDGIVMYRQAQAIVFARSLHFQPLDMLSSGPIYERSFLDTSWYGIGLSLFYVPGLLLASPWWPSDYPIAPGDAAPIPYNDPSLVNQNPLYLVAGAPVHLLVTAASVFLVARFVHELGFGQRTALWGMALYGLGSPALIYARGDFSQPLTGLCWIGALYAAARYRRTGLSRPLWLCGAAVAYAVLTRPVEGALLLPAVLWLVTPRFRNHGRPRLDLRATSVVLASFALAVLVTLAINNARFGSPWITGYPSWATWSASVSVSLPASLFSPGRGLLWQFPAVLLVPLGALRLWCCGHRVVSLALVVLPVVQLVNVVTWFVWSGGSNWGLRLFVPALPLLAVPAAIGVEALTSRLRRWLPPLLLLAGVAFGVPAIVSDIYNGYGGLVYLQDIWRWYTYPPIGVWGWGDHPKWGVRQWLSNGIGDARGVDIYWFRIANATRGFSLLVPYYLALAAAAMAWYAWRIRRGAPPEAGASERPSGEQSTVRSGQGSWPRVASSTREGQGVGGARVSSVPVLRFWPIHVPDARSREGTRIGGTGG